MEKGARFSSCYIGPREGTSRPHLPRIYSQAQPERKVTQTVVGGISSWKKEGWHLTSCPAGESRASQMCSAPQHSELGEKAGAD